MNQLSLLHRALHLHRLPPGRGHGLTATAVVRARLSSSEPTPHQHAKRHLAVARPHESIAAATDQESHHHPRQELAAGGGGGRTRTCALPTWALIGGITAGVAVALALSAGPGAGPALALGPPEGPLVEEFWDNMRRYALYVVTVSTGVAYAVLQPIVELLKNPVTALLIVAVLAGSGFLVSQVLNAMVGNSDFIYRYE
ncbi:hypothetical protein BDA96_10G142200 [Sorghum bicolor]|uniref:Uncharacterized protein ycf33 n=2 Tax=Sorghum bicolor TaxID=4558 RepID=C5Z8K3_SORBI|nr:uncharacterized protein LOC8073725 [Sorghum bicolor]EER88230.1 hypothetical protein SORBI_3010G116500 [Sorghum bicolor]KAG0513891.1 hypothetical protein BDA96_10G142200 [Sorghum bicolor]|eukprot:XP_002436863.1 uncharacterized protein LOC8073725 [Sorghum bicolor]